GISVDSTILNQNVLFVSISGFDHYVHDFIDNAIKAGATAIVGEKEICDLTVPYIKVANSRLALAKIAGNFYKHPFRAQKLIGITGTNGKTTTSFMLKHILEEAGLSCSLFGSVFNVVNGQVSSSKHTTLNALELQRQLYISKDDVIIMEVSSHGLSQFRVEGIKFDYCLFTNLDEEHLDYHKDME
ncbi:UDP-N-acetylmuramoylalanyl-D-glutamate--2,6-diaminopimelate ligase, partial [Listeria monocytogenes]